MAPRKDKNKNKNKVVEDEDEVEVECSAAATKRRRMELLTAAQFPSMHQQINTHLQLSPHHQLDDHINILSSLMPQHNFLITNHMNQMVMSLTEFWRRNFVEEEKKIKEIETKLKHKEEEVCRLRQNYFSYEEQTFFLEEILAGQGCSLDQPDQEVESGFVDPSTAGRQRRMDTACRNCRRRPASMLWLPCRHVCVCLVCERRIKQCPMCGLHKRESFMINLS